MQPVTVYLESVPFALLLLKQIFTNEDGSTGTLYLVTSDTTLSVMASPPSIKTMERRAVSQIAEAKRFPGEITTQTVTTQTNHFFAALVVMSNSNCSKALPAQPLCSQIKTLFAGYSIRLRHAS